jgi:hypothetical protein
MWILIAAVTYSVDVEVVVADWPVETGGRVPGVQSSNVGAVAANQSNDWKQRSMLSSQFLRFSEENKLILNNQC